MTRRAFRRLACDRRGSSIIEFAVLLPVLLLVGMGLFEILYQRYVSSVLRGAIQKAGRDSAIQGNDSKGALIDQKVMAMIWLVAPKATYVSSRKNYASFSNIRPEYFEDNNGNGVYDKASECFTDVNGNKTWDADPGLAGQGGANDAAVYTIQVTYPRLFPVFLKWSPNAVLTAKTILKNQPYASQNSYAATKVCP